MFWSWILNDDYYHNYHHTCHHNHPFNSSSKLWRSTGRLVLVPISILVLVHIHRQWQTPVVASRWSSFLNDHHDQVLIIITSWNVHRLT